MHFRPTSIAGSYLIQLEPKCDDRGSFARSFCRREFAAQGIQFDLAQTNLAHTRQAGTIRGLHYQEAPNLEQKIVRCLTGSVLDVIVDVRPDSPTHLHVFQVQLDSTNRLALFIPGGVAHGYQVLTDNTEFFYMTDAFYAPGIEKGIRYNDPVLNVNWPLPARNLTERDCAWPDLIPTKAIAFRS